MRRIGVVGVGPRGLSLVERIIENIRGNESVQVVLELFERRGFGSGEVWRTDQPHHLIMNITAAQISAFSDASVAMLGPVREGPSLYEWALLVANGEVAAPYAESVLREARGTHGNSYCSRSFYGHYLEWVYSDLKRRCPPHVEIREHRCTVTSVTDAGAAAQKVVPDAGPEVEVDEVVLAVGHGTVEPSPEERLFGDFAAATGSRYLPPGNPADTDLRGVEPGRRVLVRGLGLSFFDHLALLTAGRGGRFLTTRDGLRYAPSGEEPRLVCGSRRGVPLQARAENEKGLRRHEPGFLTEAAVARLRRESAAYGGLDFRRDCWPLIAKEVETVYYTALVRDAASAAVAREFQELYAATAWASDAEAGVLHKFGVPEDRCWDWSVVDRPWSPADIRSAGSWRSFVRAHLRADVAEARRGNVTSAVKAATDVLRDIRNELRAMMNDGGVEGGSYRTEVDGWFNSLHAYTSLGPPWRRVAELAALIDAGVVEIAGPGFRVDPDPSAGVFRARSAVPDDVHTATVLVDARLPAVDLDRATNPVIASLRAQGQVRRFSMRTPPAGEYTTGGVAVTPRPFRVIRPGGAVHPRRYVFGVPTEGANWVTETGIRPCVDSVTVKDSDAIARSVLGLT